MASVWDQFSDPVAAPAAAQSWDSFSDPVEQAPTLAGTGGPQHSRRYATQAQRYAADPYTYDPESGARIPVRDLNTRADASVAVPEAALSMATGMVATPAAGVAGAVSAPFIGGRRSADLIQRLQSSLTYQPRTAEGQGVAAAASYPLEKIQQGGYWAGEKAADLTGSPAVGAAVNAAVQSIPALLARGRVGNGRVSVDRPGPVLAAGEAEAAPEAAAQTGRNAGLARVSEAPSIEDLQTAKNAAYKAADNTGIVISRGALNRLKVGLVNDLKKEGLNQKLHPKAAAAVEEIVNTKGQPTLSDLETLRKIANDAKGAIEPADARLGGRIVDHIDDFEEGLSQGDLVGGSADSATAFKEARALNTRLAKSKTVQKLFDDAELQVGANYTTSGMENALRQQFKSLAKNDRKLRGFTPEERAAIRKVAVGAPLENALRMLGKFAPSGVISGYGAVAAAAVNPALAAIPVAGGISRYAATKMTMRNAKNAQDLVRRGSSVKAKQPKKEAVTAP